MLIQSVFRSDSQQSHRSLSPLSVGPVPSPVEETSKPVLSQEVEDTKMDPMSSSVDPMQEEKTEHTFQVSNLSVIMIILPIMLIIL